MALILIVFSLIRVNSFGFCEMERTMSALEFVVLIGITTAFATFAAVLAWVLRR
jgi:hypothetical protein